MVCALPLGCLVFKISKKITSTCPGGKGWVIYNERIISPKLEPEEQFLCFKSLKI